MKKKITKKVLLGLLFLVALFWLLYPTSPYLEKLSLVEQQLYDKLQKTQDIYVLKDQDPTTVIRLYLYSLKKEDYETTYRFHTTLTQEEDKEMFLKDASSYKKRILLNFKFVRSPVNIGINYASVKIPSLWHDNVYFEMTKRDGIWSLSEPPFSIQ